LKRVQIWAMLLIQLALIARVSEVTEYCPKIDDMRLPDKADLLAASGTASVEMWATGPNVLCLQGHPELSAAQLEAKIVRPSQAAGRLTAESTKEQASAGLDQLTDEERARFTELNDAYKARFGFPFIMAVKGRSKGEIMAAFERRIAHDRDQEFATALSEISRIALLRLGDMLPG
jgi:OHCU decarboxylase